MTTLRQHFIKTLQAQGLSQHTQAEYVRAVRRLAVYYHRSPDRIADQELLVFLHHLKRRKGLSDGSILSALCGLKAFYTKVLNRDWTVHWKTPAGLPPSSFPDDLRQRFLGDLQLQGLSARTQQAYVRTVRQLADH
jgi:site-specific recombinase XerC